MASRLQKFRAFMDRVDPAEDPARALERGSVVHHPTGLGRQLADYLTIHPASSHILVGGIGSGKSTELRVAQQLINQQDDMEALYFDVSRDQDLGQLKDGDLLLLLGLALQKRLPEDKTEQHKAAAKMILDQAHGYTTYETPLDDRYDPHEQYAIFHEGSIKRPLSSWYTKRVNDRATSVRTLLAQCTKPNLVVIFDALDPLSDDKLVARLIEQDVRALVSIGVGVICAAPQRLLYGSRRSIVDHVEQFHHLPYIDVERDEAGRRFLSDVLKTRDPDQLLSEAVVPWLIRASGGVLRDLVKLTRATAQHAFSRGAENLEGRDAEQAILAFAQMHRLGLDPARIAILRDVYRNADGFTPTNDISLELIETRRILHYSGPGGERFALHPALAQLLRPGGRP